jgi:NAD(P)H-hydrate epimerase
MAAIAALKVGAGLATAATAASVISTVASFAPEMMTEPLAETTECTIAQQQPRWDAVLKGKTVLAIGPGVSRNEESAAFVRRLVRESKLPIVLDADGLNAFEGRANEIDGSGRTLVLTPHPGEMARLTGLTVAQVQADRIGAARAFAGDHKCILVLKGDRTLVAEAAGRVWVNTNGNPGMAKGGTGDVLTGVIAGMLAQHAPDRFLDAVVAGVYLHGMAGDLACREFGENAMMATDVIEKLGAAFASVQWQPRTTLVRRASPQQRWRRSAVPSGLGLG